jgi:hypothetical protein
LSDHSERHKTPMLSSKSYLKIKKPIKKMIKPESSALLFR